MSHRKSRVAAVLAACLCLTVFAQGETTVRSVQKPDVSKRSALYPGHREPLLSTGLIALPFGAIEPHGWLRRQLELEADGLVGHLPELSGFCQLEGNAWLSPEGEGAATWEEVPYWMRGYAALGYVLGDEEVVALTQRFVEAAVASQTDFGWFGPRANLYAPVPGAVPAKLLTTPDGEPGLKGEYYKGQNFEELKMERVDPMVDFLWKSEGEFAGMKNEDVSARWTGFITVDQTDDYVFSLFCDDGARLWIGDELVIDEWRWGHFPSTTAREPVRLEKGVAVPVKLEFFQAGGGAGVRLGWKRGEQTYDPEKTYGHPDFMPNMSMLFVLRANYEYTGDERILDLMRRYFKWQLSVPDDMFFSGGWQFPRNGDNLDSVYWLHNRTGDEFLLDLGEKLMRTGKTWMSGVQTGGHNVDYSQGFRKPGQFYVQGKEQKYLDAAYGNYDTMYAIYGQVPGGMFGGDEFARPGHTDPHQAIETCGAVEMMLSAEILLRATDDLRWADRCEDVAVNTLPATFTADQKALRYLTCPNQSNSDKRSKNPIFANGGAMQEMDPRSHRCCQHNGGMGWPYFAQSVFHATADRGVAAIFYAASKATVQVADGVEAVVEEETRYPFDGAVRFTVSLPEDVEFPFYLRVPGWAEEASLQINGESLDAPAEPNRYLVVEREWSDGDVLELTFPTPVRIRTWERNKDSVSVERGAVTFSVKMEEIYERSGGSDDWPAWEIRTETPWNYGLIVDESNPAETIEVVEKPWPADGQPFQWDRAPVELRVKAKRIPNWTENYRGTVAKLQQSPVKSDEPVETISMIPMGAGRLRISALPTIGDGPHAGEWRKPVEPPASSTHDAFPMSAMTDDKVPEKSIAKTTGEIPAFSWWPNAGAVEYVTQVFDEPRTVSTVEIFWYADEDATTMPESWQLFYRDGEEWKPVEKPSAYGMERDVFNVTNFKPVKTDGLKLEAKLGGRSGGIYEWRIK